MWYLGDFGSKMIRYLKKGIVAGQQDERDARIQSADEVRSVLH